MITLLILFNEVYKADDMTRWVFYNMFTRHTSDTFLKIHH